MITPAPSEPATQTTELISANHASAMAATLAGRANRDGHGFVSGVYPITPQTECIEQLCREEFDKGRVIRVESEHSAMAVCIGASIAGARTFTASSSNGLSYMTENVFAAAFFRLPVVMMAVNRTLGPPWNIWVDHGDTLALRDSGWLQFYCENNQEVFDMTLLAYRLAEDSRVLLPAMVCQDAFVLSHTLMQTAIADQQTVDAFLPRLELPHQLTEVPRIVGGLDFPHETEMHRKQHADAMTRVIDVHRELQDEFEAHFGRRPADPVVPYRLDDADVVVVSIGTTASTARAAVDQAREQGIAAGALRINMFRPFPEAHLRRLLAERKRIAVIDRDLCPGFGGIVWGEVRGCVESDALVQNFLVGLGGGDIRPNHIAKIIEDMTQRETPEDPILMETA